MSNIKIKRSYWENGKLFRIYSRKDNKEHGIQKAWHDNGQLQYIHLYKEDVVDGEWHGWWKNGKAEYNIKHVNGGRHGTCKWWDEDGIVDTYYYIYDKIVSKEEWREYELTVQLAGI